MLFTIGLDPGKKEERNCLSSIKEPNGDVERNLEVFCVTDNFLSVKSQEKIKFFEVVILS